jgi:hypothetical protein
MSSAAIHLSREIRKLCERCWQRKARYQYRGVVRADRHHTLCFECFRSERERRRAIMLVERPPFGRAFMKKGDR